MDVTKHTVARSGQAPLAFRGELLAEVKGAWHTAVERNRWHDVAVYRTAGGRYVVAVCYQTRWEGESNVAWAAATDDAGNLELLLREAEAEVLDGAVLGYPPGYEAKQARLLLDLRQRYADRVREVLAAIPEAAERIE
jgi:hypothetical protein